jgi:N-acetylmuramoyl-L-alanine amidase
MAKRKETKYIAVHCAATPAGMDIGVKEIDRWHRQKGFLKVGYHFVIRRTGQIELGRDEDEIGAHVQGYNAVSIGVCLVGGVDADDVSKAENNFTKEQFSTLRTLLERLQIQYPDAEVLGHRDFPDVAKACPSFDVRAWLKSTN